MIKTIERITETNANDLGRLPLHERVLATGAK